MDDFAILREADGDLGRELFVALQNVRLFASAPEAARQDLFRARGSGSALDLAPDHPLRRPLAVFAALVQGRPASDRELALACRSVAEWAEGFSSLSTAVAFSEVAAHVVPSDPEMANLAGRACRHAGERARAELWYERGLGLARRSGSALEYINGHLGFGNLLRDYGEHGHALRWIKRAGVAARRSGLREAAAEALHDAYAIAYLRGDFARATSFARRAARVYPVHARRMPYFGADLALLLSRRGFYGLALDLLRVVQPHLAAPVDALQIWSLLTYAAGGCGDHAAYAEALAQVRKMAEMYPEASAAALAYAAAGAHLIKDWDSAESLITEASGRARGDILAEELAARVARDITHRNPGIPNRPMQDPVTSSLWGIVPDVAARLRRWRGPTWRPKKG
jgi:tetratricopeptide (TPR) repeat protein